jgi:hypothetical protein
MTEIRLRAGRPRHRGPGILPGASCSTLQVKTLFQISAALAFEFLNISCSHATPLLSQETTRGSVQYSLHSPVAVDSFISRWENSGAAERANYQMLQTVVARIPRCSQRRS